MKLILTILSLVFIISCKKPDAVDSQNLQGTYKTDHIASVKAPIMYIQNVKITDTGIINTFLRVHGVLNYFVYSSTQVITSDLLSINFGINDSANFQYKNNLDILKAKKIQYPNNELIIHRYDTIKLIVNYPEETLASECYAITNYINTNTYYPPQYSYSPLWNGYALKNMTPWFILIYENNELKLPLLTYTTGKKWLKAGLVDSSWCTTQNTDSWARKTNNNIEDNLLLHDTLVVQEKSVTLTRQ